MSSSAAVPRPVAGPPAEEHLPRDHHARPGRPGSSRYAGPVPATASRGTRSIGAPSASSSRAAACTRRTAPVAPCRTGSGPSRREHDDLGVEEGVAARHVLGDADEERRAEARRFGRDLAAFDAVAKSVDVDHVLGPHHQVEGRARASPVAARWRSTTTSRVGVDRPRALRAAALHERDVRWSRPWRRCRRGNTMREQPPATPTATTRSSAAPATRPAAGRDHGRPRAMPTGTSPR